MDGFAYIMLQTLFINVGKYSKMTKLYNYYKTSEKPYISVGR